MENIIDPDPESSPTSQFSVKDLFSLSLLDGGGGRLIGYTMRVNKTTDLKFLRKHQVCENKEY